MEILASIFCILSLYVNICAQPPLDCKRFREGNFKINSESGISYIERRGSTQIEYDETYTDKVVTSVTWTNDCTYILKLKKKPQTNPKKVKMFKKMVVAVEILETRENSYIARVSSNISPISYQVEIIKIE